MPKSKETQLSPESIEFLRPLVIYGKLSTPRLLTGFYLENRLFEMQVYLMLLHRSTLPLPVSFQDWQRKSRELKLTDLEPLYKRCHDDLLIQLMFILKVQWHLMLKELNKRFQYKPVGMAILMESWEDIERLWIQKRRLKADAADVKQEGLLKGLELLDEARKNSLEDADHQRFLNLPAPSLPVEMDELEGAAWQALLKEMWTPSLRASFSNVLPLVRGDMESTAGAVDEFLHEQTRKFKRRRIILEGKEEFPKAGSESWRAHWDFSKAAGEGRRQEIEGEIHSRNRANRTPDVSNRMLEGLRVAKKRWGAKAVKALRYCVEGQTQEEAARLAGIGVSTLKSYISKLNKEFSKKK